MEKFEQERKATNHSKPHLWLLGERGKLKMPSQGKRDGPGHRLAFLAAR
jgi:hypothetical protein